MAFPMTTIEDLEISRLLCGTNSFFGHSHISEARNIFLRRHFTVERIVEVMAAMAEENINGTVSMQSQKMRDALDMLEDETGHNMHWIATPGGKDLAELKEGIRQCADLGAAVCMPHTSYTDSHLHISEDRIDGAGEICELIRDLGMIPGWSTHRPEVIGVTMRAGYDIATIIQPFNPIGFLCAVETDWMARTINSFPGTIISIKPLAAGRILPPTGISFSYSHLDDRHTVCIGCMSPEEAKEDIALARACIEGTDPQVELQKTRSKETLG
ncbi:MAG: hypothetical protein R6V19_11550 [Armatimonadota bacterium]